MKISKQALSGLLAVFFSLATQSLEAAINVLTCEPEWMALTQELAGDKAAIVSATTARQDPHHIEARPSLIAQARRADLLVCTGAELEVGWLPLLQRESGNAAIQPGQSGYFEAADYVRLLERPGTVDRSMGDMHAAGNPHIHTDPRNLLPVAEALSKRLRELDPANADHYTARYQDFSTRLRAAIAGWEQRAKPWRGTPVLVHHKSWSYLTEWLGLVVVADLEPKPGIDPSVASLGQLLDKLKTRPAKMTLRAAYLSPKPSDWIQEQTGIKAVELPFTVGGTTAAKDLFSLFDDTLNRIEEAMK